MQILDVFNPFTNDLIEQVPLTNLEAARNMVSAAKRAFQSRELATPKHVRLARLQALIELMSANKDRLVKMAIQEGGKPMNDTVVEVERAINGVEMARHYLAVEAGREIPMGLTPATSGRMAITTYEPLGVCLGIGAFNHPLNMVVHLVVPALAVGAPVIIKPALKTPLVCRAFVELVHEAGFAPMDCQLLICSNEVTAELVKHPQLSLVNFIGAAQVGWGIRSRLAPGVKCVLEHGGAAPVILAPGYDIEKSLDNLLKAAYYHAGQVCVSAQRLFVAKAQLPSVIDKIQNRINQIVVGDPAMSQTAVGPMIDATAADLVQERLKQSLEHSGELVVAGDRVGNLMHPSLVVNSRPGAFLTENEIFGPVFSVECYETVDQAIELANDVPYCFQGAIYSEQLDEALGLAKKLKGTAVMVNDHPAFRADWMPFGGSELSGLGLGGIPQAMKDMQLEKLTVIKSKSLQ